MSAAQSLGPPPANGDDADRAANPAVNEDGSAPAAADSGATGGLSTDRVEPPIATDEKSRRTERRRARKQAQLNSTSGAIGADGEAPKGADGAMPARLERIKRVMKSAGHFAGLALEPKRYVRKDDRCRGSEKKGSRLLHQALVSCAIPFPCCGNRAGNANARLRAHV